MSSTITITPFIPSPLAIKERMRKELKGNLYRVMDFISDTIFSYPETRKTLEIELSCRYIANALQINFGFVSRILKILQEKKFIEIVKVGCGKIGSLIRIIMCCTQTTNISCTQATKQKKQNLKETNRKPSVVCPDSKVKISEKKDLTYEENLAPSSPPDPGEKVLSEFTPPPGVPEKVLMAGIQKLQARGVQDINKTLSIISTEIKKRMANIRSMPAYFRELCKSIDISAPAGSPAPSAPHRVVIDRSDVKRESDIKQAEFEKKQINSFIEFVNSVMPELMVNYRNRAAIDWKKETKGFAGAVPLPGYIESKIKIYASEKGIWDEWIKTTS